MSLETKVNKETLNKPTLFNFIIKTSYSSILSPSVIVRQTFFVNLF